MTEWALTLNNMDIPLDYYLTFAAIIGTVAVTIFPYFIAHEIMSLLTYNLTSQENADFICKKYLPELRDSISHLSIPNEEKKSVFNKIMGVVIKMMLAFVYQEHVLPVPELYNVVGLHVGAIMMPYINQVADKLTGFSQTDQAVLDSVNVYPGDTKCRAYTPHSIWHEESGNGFLELVFTADYINRVITNAQESIIIQ